MPQKTILLPVLFGLTLRNYLRTDFLEEILKSGHRLVCLVPSLDIDGVVEEFSPRGVEFHAYPTYRPGWLEKRLRDLREVQFARTHPMVVLKVKENDQKALNPLRWLMNYKIIGPLFPRGRHSILDGWYEASHRTSTVDQLWDEIRPDLFLSTNSYFWEELPLLAKARETGTPVFGNVHSWDNLTTKNKLPYRFTRMGVWNDVMFSELRRFYPDYEPDCRVVGVPQFDYYKDMDKLGKPREQFLSELGLDPTLPLISYTGVPDVISPSGMHDVRLVLEAIRDGRLPACNVLVRHHQKGNQEPYKALEGAPNLHMECPGRMSSVMKDGFNPSWEDMRHFADTLRHSDVTINTRSTVSVDASFFETPIINPGADFSPDGKADAHIRGLYAWEHYLPIVGSGGVEVADSPEAYVTAIREALDNPGCRAEGRAKLRQLFAGDTWGEAGATLAREVVDTLGAR